MTYTAHRHAAFVGVVSIALGASAFAGITPSSAPAGFDSVATLNGGAGTPHNPSRWFSIEDGQGQYTAWANKKIDFNVTLDTTPREYLVGVTAKNWTSAELPPDYTQFKVGVSLDNQFLDYLYIDASDDVWSTSWIDVGELAGDATITLNWVNDSYTPDKYDANIALGAVQFAATIPAPAPIALLLAGFGLAAPREKRR